MRIDKWIWLSLGLGVLALLAVGASHLALTDIHHADGDLSLEWNVLRVCFAIIVASQVAALVTLTKVLRRDIHRGCPQRRGKSTAAVNEVYRFRIHDSTDRWFRS